MGCEGKHQRSFVQVQLLSVTQLSLHSPVAMAANQALIEAVKAVQDLQTSRVAVYKRFDE